MEADENDIKLIDRYLQQNMSDAEQATFEDRLKTDVQFKKAFEEIQLLIEGIRESARKKLLMKLKDHETRLPYLLTVIKRKKRRERYRTASLAASFILAGLFVSVLFIKPLLLPSDNDVFQQYFTMPPSYPVASIRGTSDELELKMNAFRLYNSGNTKKAMVSFEKYLKEYSDRDVSFYLGTVYLKEGYANKAVDILSGLSAKSDNDFEAKWYLGLSYLKLDEYEKAKQNFMEVKESGTYFSLKAAELLMKL